MKQNAVNTNDVIFYGIQLCLDGSTTTAKMCIRILFGIPKSLNETYGYLYSLIESQSDEDGFKIRIALWSFVGCLWLFGLKLIASDSIAHAYKVILKLDPC